MDGVQCAGWLALETAQSIETQSLGLQSPPDVSHSASLSYLPYHLMYAYCKVHSRRSLVVVFPLSFCFLPTAHTYSVFCNFNAYQKHKQRSEVF